MSCWTIIPIRGLACGKSRLSGILSTDQRMALNCEMLTRTLDAVSSAQIGLSKCLVVSDDAHALEFITNLGALGLRESTPSGLNPALEQAREFVIALGATEIMVLAADLPMISSFAIAKVLSTTTDDQSPILFPDKNLSGTNGLWIRDVFRVPFLFGLDSLHRHKAAFLRMGATARYSFDDVLSFDLDSPEDYQNYLTISALSNNQVATSLTQSLQSIPAT